MFNYKVKYKIQNRQNPKSQAGPITAKIRYPKTDTKIFVLKWIQHTAKPIIKATTGKYQRVLKNEYSNYCN